MIVVCEDDHEFTGSYRKDVLIRNMVGAYRQGAELLNCGVGGFGNVVPLSPVRGWVDWFWCTQFVVVFSSMFPKILSYNFRDNDTADGILSRLSCHSQVMCSPLSRQKCFGYSDITAHSSQDDLQNGIFACANERLSRCSKLF